MPQPCKHISDNGHRIKNNTAQCCAVRQMTQISRYLIVSQPVHGTVSPRQPIVDVLTYCWNVRNVMVTVCQTCQLLKNYVMPQTINCLTKLFQTATMFYTVYCHCHLQRRSTIILGVVCTHFRFPSMGHIYLTVILSFVCYINSS